MWLIIYLPLYLLQKRIPKSALQIEVDEAKKAKLKEDRKAKYAEALATSSSLGPKKLGYTKTKRGQMYILSCTHQIRATKVVKIMGSGMLNKNVWCEICNEERQVTAAPFFVQ